MSHLWLYYNKWQHCFNSVFLTRFAVFSGESFHADTLISIFLVQRNAFSSVLTGRTITRRLHKGKDTAVSKDHFTSKLKYPVTWRITFIHVRQMLNLRQIPLFSLAELSLVSEQTDWMKNKWIKHELSGEHFQKFIRILLCSTSKTIADALRFEFHI